MSRWRRWWNRTGRRFPELCTVQRGTFRVATVRQGASPCQTDRSGTPASVCEQPDRLTFHLLRPTTLAGRAGSSAEKRGSWVARSKAATPVCAIWSSAPTSVLNGCGWREYFEREMTVIRARSQHLCCKALRTPRPMSRTDRRRYRRLLLRLAKPVAARQQRERHGLLRQYFPKEADLSQHGADALNAGVRAQNARPRKTLGRHGQSTSWIRSKVLRRPA